LTEHELLKLDLQGVNDYFKAFRDDDWDIYSPLLPPIETIIKESYKIKINDSKLNEIRRNFKESQVP
jgi:hypothetical protein